MEYEFEELADMAVDELNSFIDAENRFIKTAHKLMDALLNWDYIIGHIDERLPKKAKHLHALNKKIIEKLLELRAIIESEEIKELGLEKEEKTILKKLREDAAHRNWRAVKQDVIDEVKEEEAAIRLEVEELRKIRAVFSQLKRLMEKSSIIADANLDPLNQKEKLEYENLEEYYFIKLFKVISSYDKIFNDLLEKEMKMERELKEKFMKTKK